MTSGAGGSNPTDGVWYVPRGAPARHVAKGLTAARGLAWVGPQLYVTHIATPSAGRVTVPASGARRHRFDGRAPVSERGAREAVEDRATSSTPSNRQAAWSASATRGCYDKGGSSCAGTRQPLASLAPHAVPVGVAVKGDVAFVAENGSSYPENPTGSDIQRIDLRTGKRTRFWHSPVEHDPTGAVIGPDGDLYVALYASGKVVRFGL
jgi:glucose/arabinose dehydrogenase